MASDPVEIMRRHICEHETCAVCPHLIRVGFKAMRDAGWRIVQLYSYPYETSITEEWTGDE